MTVNRYWSRDSDREVRKTTSKQHLIVVHREPNLYNDVALERYSTLSFFIKRNSVADVRNCGGDVWKGGVMGHEVE